MPRKVVDLYHFYSMELLILDFACWYLNESSLHKESVYVIIASIQGIPIYQYLALGRLTAGLRSSSPLFMILLYDYRERMLSSQVKKKSNSPIWKKHLQLYLPAVVAALTIASKAEPT